MTVLDLRVGSKYRVTQGPYKDDQGEVQGGVMYYIEEGLGPAFRPLAIMFSISGLLGCIVFFQANQLSQIIRDYFYTPMNLFFLLFNFLLKMMVKTALVKRYI